MKKIGINLVRDKIREVKNSWRFAQLEKLITKEGDRWSGTLEGLPALAIRHPRGKHWEGWVQIPSYHRYHSKRMSVCTKLPQCLPTTVAYLKPPNNEIFECDHRLGVFLKEIDPAKLPHGGIVGAGEIKSAEGWWWAMDCGHTDDFSPGLLKLPGIKKMELPPYRDLKFAQGELAKLARLIKELGAHA